MKAKGARLVWDRGPKMLYKIRREKTVTCKNMFGFTVRRKKKVTEWVDGKTFNRLKAAEDWPFSRWWF